MQFQAFLSYAHVDEEYSKKAISQLCDLLTSEVRKVTGHKDFTIFRDITHIRPGQIFVENINLALSQTLILIVVITPSYFESGSCLEELDAFIEREKQLGRNDLILPIYFTESFDMSRSDYGMATRPEKVKRAARIFKQRQYVDLRRFDRFGFLEKDGNPKQEAINEIEKLGNTIKIALRIYQSQLDAINNKTIENFPLKIEGIEDIESSIFKERLSHFQIEKEYLADTFGDYLLARLEYQCQNQNVLLFIDSGSTLFHFFNKIGNYAKEARQVDRFAWIDKLAIVTNNLAGVQWLMKYGRISNDKTSEIAVQCVVLPGEPSATYNATIGFSHSSSNQFQKILSSVSTPEIIKNIYQKNQSSSSEKVLPAKIIVLIAGNWIRIRQSVPRTALPLTRGKGQLIVKQTLIDIADEVYVISPLGKVFANHKREYIHGILQEYINKRHPGHPAYDELKHEYETNKIRLVTTYREKEDILGNLSNLLAEVDFLGAQKVEKSDFLNVYAFRQAEFKNIPNLMFKFAHPEKDIATQLELEFPHIPSRNRRFLSLFYVNASVLDHLSE